MLRNRKISDWILKERLLACVLEREKSERPVSPINFSFGEAAVTQA